MTRAAVPRSYPHSRRARTTVATDAGVHNGGRLSLEPLRYFAVLPFSSIPERIPRTAVPENLHWSDHTPTAIGTFTSFLNASGFNNKVTTNIATDST